MTRLAIAVAAVALAGCSKDASLDLDAINALVQPALRSQLVFERRDVVLERGPRRTTYTLAAPRGWTQHGEMSVNLRPDGEPAGGSHLTASNNCDGQCTPKPWADVADRVNFAPRARGTVVKDARSPGRRTLIAELSRGGAPMTEIVVAWWTDGAPSYHSCTASLAASLGAAAPAFEAACQAIAIAGDD
jgi:hypothetical protein